MPNRTLLLIGAGHAHLEVLRRWRPTPGTALVVLTREPASLYSGMLPGHIAGQYTEAEAQVAVAPLVQAAGGRLILDEAVSLDPVQRRVLTLRHGIVAYGTVSLNIGSRPNTAGIAGAAEHAIPVKPIDRFLARFAALEAQAASMRHIAMAGGGAAGVELILAVERRLRRPGLSFTLVTGSADILPGYPRAFRTRLLAVLAARGIAVRTGARITAAVPGGLVTPSGPIAADATLLTTEAAAPGWLAGSGLAVDEAGFLRVDPALQSVSDPAVFAAGDVIAFDPPIPRSGVFAVRAGPVLAHNLAAARLRAYRPQRHWLTIIGDGEGNAVATRNGLVASGAWVHAWKDRIDRRFVNRYRRLQNREQTT